jgi:hypothetical protein
MRTLMISVMTLVAAIAQGQQVEGVPPGLPTSPKAAVALNEILKATPVMPVGPDQLLQIYERQMTDISRQLGSALTEVLESVRNGDLDPDVADFISKQTYDVAMMRYELLSVLHADLAKKIADSDGSAAADATADGPIGDAKGLHSAKSESLRQRRTRPVRIVTPLATSKNQ